jgi:hypothetical protein
MSDEFALTVQDDDEIVEGRFSIIQPMSLEDAIGTYRDMIAFIKRVMRKGIDYGDDAGGKDALYKPGAEKLARFFRLQISNRLAHSTESWETPITATSFPLFHYRYTTEVRSMDGTLICTSDGEANSYESKWRWRWVPVGQLPPKYAQAYTDGLLELRPGEETEFAFAIEAKATSGAYGKPLEYWQSWEADIAAGRATKFDRKTKAGKMLPAWKREGTTVRVPNEDIYSQVNTMLKIALKRSYVGAVIIAANAGEFFTSDVDEIGKQFAEDANTTIRMAIPGKDAAARRLITYVRSLGVPGDPGLWIKQLLEENQIEWKLENWDAILDAIDAKVNAAISG